jgi:hypothetical protein
MQRKFLNMLGVMIVVLGAAGLVWAKNDSLPPTSILKGNNRIFTCVFYEGAVADYQQSSKSANSVLAWCYVMIEK